jgi:hypothetical protein
MGSSHIRLIFSILFIISENTKEISPSFYACTSLYYLTNLLANNINAAKQSIISYLMTH